MEGRLQEPTLEGSVTTSDPDRNIWIKYLKNQYGWLEKQRSTLMVVASLTATMAFQAGVSPPGGVWQDNSNGDKNFQAHAAGYSIMAHNYPSIYNRFLAFNTSGFVASLSIILLLVSGLPINNKFFMWILMVTLWIAITAMALTYAISISVLTPSSESTTLYTVTGIAILAWCGLMGLLLVAHTVRLIVKIIRKLVRIVSPRRRYPNSVNMNRSGV